MNITTTDHHPQISKALLRKTGVRVKQSMPGRIRIRVNSLQRREKRAGWMRKHLKNSAGVTNVKTRFSTGSVVIYFRPDLTTIRALLTEVVKQILNPMVYPDPPEVLPGFKHLCEVCDSETKASFSTRLRRTLWLTGFMTYSAIRMWVFGLPLVQTPLSLIGIVAMLGTAPLVRQAYVDMTDKKKVTVTPFLTAGCLATIAMGQAFSALQIVWIYNVAEVTEEYVAQRSRQAIRNLLEIAPANAFIMVDGMEVETPVANIRPGDIVAVHTGDKIPVDGIVRKGEALVDEASINGRSEDILHGHGNQVFAGTIVSQGVLFIETVKTGEETYLAHIMQMVEKSLGNKAPVEHKADQLAARLMKIGITATALTLIFTLNPMRALTVMLVMSCPCATVLAASSAITAAVTNAARDSILIKGGHYLEIVGKADVFCFDKTGTLTTEQPEIISIATRTPSLSEDAILAMAATAESHNQHPIAKAILAETKVRNLSPEPHAVCQFTVGRGVLCTVGGDAVILVGNRQFMAEHEIDIRWFDKKAATQRQRGNSVVFVAKNSKVQGMLGIANPVRPEAIRVLNCLRGDGVKTMHLVTGDNDEVAQTVMDVFPFDDCRAALMPEDKAAWVSELRKENTVIMVGDGINDALALAQADIGIAMGAGGSEVAMEAADIALADSNLEGLMKVRNLSHQTLKVIDQNHYLAVSTDLIGAALAMVGILSPIMAGMIHIFHTGGILLNSGRLLSWEPPIEPMENCCGCPRGCKCGNERHKKCDSKNKTG